MNYRNILSYVLPLVVAFFTLIPPIMFRIPAPQGEYWPLLMACAGLAGIRILFIHTSIIVKIVAVTSFVSCFFSGIPYISFNAYPSIVFCCYLFILLTRMDSWKPMFTMIKAILCLNMIFLAMQLMGEDRLLNFGLERVACWGVIGHHMQAGSFSVVLAAVLGVLHPIFWLFPIFVGIICKSAWTVLCAGVAFLLVSKSKVVRLLALGCAVGFVIICITGGKIQQGLSPEMGRLMIWKRSVQLLNERPWTGWGPASYKVVFPALSEIKGIPWKTAHNDPVQLAFELGYPLCALFALLWIMIFFVLWDLRGSKNGRYLWVGYLVISLDSLIHFPSRMIQCVPLIIVLLAYGEALYDRKEILASS